MIRGGRLLVVSPHLDDAVFGCSALLAQRSRVLVATLFAGGPPRPVPLTDWDAACGFTSTEQALEERRREDAAALGLLGAGPCWLDFPDAQYRAAAPPLEALRAPLDTLIARHRPRDCLFPMGLFHEDHRLAHDAVLAALRRARGVRALVYEDTFYRRIPGAREARLRGWREAGIAARVAGERAPSATKRRAVRCYASQLRGLASAGRPGHADLEAPERYWLLRGLR